jgi:hypothetical protein
MQVAFKTNFLQCNILVKYVSSIFYQRESIFFKKWGPWIYNDFYAITSYFIKFYNEKEVLNTILTNQFQTYLFPIFLIPIF